MEKERLWPLLSLQIFEPNKIYFSLFLFYLFPTKDYVILNSYNHPIVLSVKSYLYFEVLEWLKKKLYHAFKTLVCTACTIDIGKHIKMKCQNGSNKLNMKFCSSHGKHKTSLLGIWTCLFSITSRWYSSQQELSTMSSLNTNPNLQELGNRVLISALFF